MRVPTDGGAGILRAERSDATDIDSDDRCTAVEY